MQKYTEINGGNKMKQYQMQHPGSTGSPSPSAAMLTSWLAFCPSAQKTQVRLGDLPIQE